MSGWALRAHRFLLKKDGCPDGFKCAPCLEPPFGQPSGACEL
jgi:hypothetical protein